MTEAEAVVIRKRGRPRIADEVTKVEIKVSKKLLELFDAKAKSMGYGSRSEALRQLIISFVASN